MVTQESSCPFYDLGDELKIENSTLSISPYKPVCLYLAKEIKKIVTTEDNVSKFTSLTRVISDRIHSSLSLTAAAVPV